MAEAKLLNKLYQFRKLIAVFVIIVAFFSFYNLFLIDRTLENLSFALEETALAYDIEDTAGLDMVLTQAGTKEISPVTLNSWNMANLEYSKSIFQTGTTYKVLDYAEVALRTLINSKEKERGIVLALLDNINRPIRKGFFYLAYLPRYILRPRLAHAAGEEADSASLFVKAGILEKEGALQNLALTFEDFIKQYPDNENLPLVMLRLGFTYQRLGQYDKAADRYKKLIGISYPRKEAKIAEILLDNLKQKDELLKEANLMIIKTAELSPDEKAQKQELFYKLGLIYSKLLNFKDAGKFFKRAAEADQTSDLCVKSQFNMAWIYKNQFKPEQSLDAFTNIAEKDPSNSLVLDARYQLADIKHAEGKYEESIAIFEDIAKDYKDSPVSPLCLFQIGASYLYDMNDAQKAEEAFARLLKEYPDSPYAKYLAPDNPVGMFVAYLVPRATQVVAWRAAGLICLVGYSGELVNFKITLEQEGFNLQFRDWLGKELPDTVGNLYVDIKGTELTFEKGKATGNGIIVMGPFTVEGETEGRLELTKTRGVTLVITKAILAKIPIPPILINRAIGGVVYIVNKYFPATVTKVSMEKELITIEGFGSKRLLERSKEQKRELLGVDIEFEDIKDPEEQKRVYALYKEKFPESSFSPSPEYDSVALFYDFFTRMFYYGSFKLLETVKDSKLDYERSIRTFGRLVVKEGRFGVSYTDGDINTSLNKYIRDEFPWIMDNKFLFDIRGLEFHFKDNGDMEFQANLALGYGKFPDIKPESLDIKGIAVMEIDKESRLPKFVFKKATLNNEDFPVDKLNLVSSRCLEMLKERHLPLKLSSVKITKGRIALLGKGARDFVGRIFSDPHLFVIFQIRHWDLWAAGITRLKDMPGDKGDYYRDHAYSPEKE